MHELQLMRQVVSLVESLNLRTRGVPSIVRIHVSNRSHLAEHGSQDLNKMFELASQGTSIQGAKLEIYFIPVKGKCETCGTSLIWSPSTWDCTECGSAKLEWEDRPEIVLREVEFVGASFPQSG